MKNQLRAIILADDLTGAADSALQFRNWGANCVVQLKPGKVPSSAEVCVWTSHSRALVPDQAALRVREFVPYFPNDDSVTIFKKVDSTLRGNIGAEVQELMNTGRFSAAVVAPAYPQSGRTTKSSIHYVHGQPVAETEFGRDASGPSTSNLVEILAKQMSEPVAAIQSAEELRHVLRYLTDANRIFAVDAESVESLQSIAACLGITEKPILWVGSAGLASAIGQMMRTFTGAASSIPVVKSERPMVVIGSRNTATKRQIQILKTQRTVRTYVVDGLQTSLNPNGQERPLDPGEVLLIHTKQARDGKGSDAVASDEMAKHLAAQAAAVAKHYRIDGLVAAGGDTAIEVCRNWGIDQLHLHDMVSEGVPLAIGLPQGLPIITKAGGFGDETVLVRAVRRLEQGGGRSEH